MRDALGIGVIIGIVFAFGPYLIGVISKWVWYLGDDEYHRQFWWKSKGSYKMIWAGGKDMDFKDED